MLAFEEETRQLEIKYDTMLQGVFAKRKAAVADNKELYSEFWLRVLTNHKIIKDFINEEDKDALKYLTDLSYTKLEDANVY